MRRCLLAICMALVLLMVGCGVQSTAVDAISNDLAESDRASEQATSPPAENGTAENDSGAQDSSDSYERQEESVSQESEEKPFYSNRLLLALVAVALILTIAVVWFVYHRKSKQEKSAPMPKNACRDVVLPGSRTIPVTLDYERLPIFRVGNLHNIGQREEQQDSFCLSDIQDEQALRGKGLLAVVADGMGGLEGGAAISQLVTDIFRERYAQMDIPDPAAFLYDTAQAAECAVEEYMRRTGVDGGSTLVAVLIRGNGLHFVSVGDSRIYLLRDGDLFQINREHTFGALLREKAARGEVEPEEPFINPRRDALVAYIGMGAFNTVDRSGHPVPLAVGDKVLLCSDGVFNALGQDALAASLAGEAFIAAQRVEEEILAQAIPGQDNFTGVILEYVTQM